MYFVCKNVEVVPLLTRLFANLSLPTPELALSSFGMRLVVQELAQ
jgi:hypothetical protein